MELFGFDPELPLAKDMEAKGVKAIVMEVRFSQVGFLLRACFVQFISPCEPELILARLCTELPVRATVLPCDISSVRFAPVLVLWPGRSLPSSLLS